MKQISDKTKMNTHYTFNEIIIIHQRCFGSLFLYFCVCLLSVYSIRVSNNLDNNNHNIENIVNVLMFEDNV